MRTRKSNRGSWFVGYKKHTLRLWLPQVTERVTLAPLMSWAAPANRQDLLFLEPSLRYCHRVLEFVPDFVVADMAYIHLQMQRRLREQFRVGIVTGLRPDFDLPKALEPGLTLRCAQGQRLEWLGLHERDQLHWFGVRESQPLCPWCPEQVRCPREFSFTPTDHEIVFGTVPYSSTVAKRLLRQVRSWIEASQSFEKNQLGLSQIYLNSLRFCWTMALLADTVGLLRSQAAIKEAPSPNLLHNLLPQQLNLEIDLFSKPRKSPYFLVLLVRFRFEFGNTLLRCSNNCFAVEELIRRSCAKRRV